MCKYFINKQLADVSTEQQARKHRNNLDTGRYDRSNVQPPDMLLAICKHLAKLYATLHATLHATRSSETSIFGGMATMECRGPDSRNFSVLRCGLDHPPAGRGFLVGAPGSDIFSVPLLRVRVLEWRSLAEQLHQRGNYKCCRQGY